MPRQPKVTAGPRTAERFPDRAERNPDETSELALQNFERPGRAPGRYFVSKHRAMRVILWGIPDRIVDGSTVQGDSFTACFENGLFFVSEEDPQYERKVKLLEGKKLYGEHGDFWDADKKAQLFREKKVAQMREEFRTMQQDPEFVKLLKQDLEASEFVHLSGTAPRAPEPTAAE